MTPLDVGLGEGVEGGEEGVPRRGLEAASSAQKTHWSWGTRRSIIQFKGFGSQSTRRTENFRVQSIASPEGVGTVDSSQIQTTTALQCSVARRCTCIARWDLRQGELVGTSEPGTGPVGASLSKTETMCSNDDIHLTWRCAFRSLACLFYEFGHLLM
ncbi:hypothetical protein Taro_008222 [Colocasia esculenta]|uniref:Uncharacterized protein n=1 Tax=Colocasia esculenta TaxID=4460 RepID=A0A843TT58_COLES|nr:hypothetical protein [Colocasia esculenta]